MSKKWTADALKTLNALAHSNIPINTDAAIDIFEKARITIGLAGGYTKSVGYEAIRSLLRRPQSENLAMLLYGTLFASGSADLAQFSQQRSQKYLFD